MMNVWRTSTAVRGFLKNTEGNLNAALIELRGTLQNLSKITSDISTVTEEVRQVTDIVANLEKDAQSLFQYVKNELATNTAANFAGMKAGVKTGVATLVKTLKQGRGDNHEGRTD
jgi:ABC-type transporter Mla subunit MlaD